jgi:glutamyl-tRNA reductase
MGRLAAEALATADVDRVVVANRTLPHAEHVAGTVDVDGTAVGLDGLATAAAEADVLIAATSSPDHVVEPADLAGAGETVVVDVAQPRDVAPAVGEVPSVAVYDLDDLEAVTDETRERRREEAADVEAMIDAEFERLMEAFKRKRADEAIGAMYAGAERVKERELDRAIDNLEANGGLTDAQRDTVEALADSLVGQLLAAPTRSLRDAAAEDDWTTIHTAMRLFDPEFDPTPPGRDAGGDAEAEADADAEAGSGGPDRTIPDDLDVEVSSDAKAPPEWVETTSDD